MPEATQHPSPRYSKKKIKCVQGTKPTHRESLLGYKWGVLMGQASAKCLCAWRDAKPMLHLLVCNTGKSLALLLFLGKNVDIFACSYILCPPTPSSGSVCPLLLKARLLVEIFEDHGHRKCKFWASESLVSHCIWNGVPQFKKKIEGK